MRTSDRACKALDEQPEKLSAHYITPSVYYSDYTLTALMDKMVQKELAAQCGMKVAEGKCIVTSSESLDQEIKNITFPCFVKSLASANMVGSKSILAACENANELIEAIRYASERRCEKVLVEQYLRIDEELCLYGVAGNGEVYVPACVVTFREGSDEHKGVTAEGKVVPAEKVGVMKGQIEDMVRKIGLTGIFCVDILRCKDDLYYSEMNLRFGGSGYAVTLAGANLPAALADIVYEQKVNRPMEVSREVRFLNERIEFDAYLNGHMSRREYKTNLSGDQERVVQSDSDEGPWKEFQKMTYRKIIKKNIKRLIGRT